MKKIILITFFGLLSLELLCLASEIELKNGRILEGKIINASTESIIIDLKGTRLEYSLSEIRSIDGKKITYEASRSDYARHISKRREYALEISNAQQFLRERKYDQAAESYRVALELNPESVIAYNGLAIAEMSMGNLRKAIDYCQKGIAIDDDFPNIYGVRGQAHLFLQEFDQAEADFNKALDLITNHQNFPKNAQLNKLKESMQGLLKELDRRKKIIARRSLPLDQRAVPTADDKFLDHFNQGKDYALTGQYLLAVNELEQAAKINQDDYETFNLLGDVHDSLGRYDEAKTAYNKSIDLNPEYALAKYNLAILYANRFRDKGKAVQYLRNAVINDPLYAEAYHNLGILHNSLGDYDLAIENFKRAISLFRSKGELYHVERLEHDLSQIYIESGNSQLAGKGAGSIKTRFFGWNLPVVSFVLLSFIYGSIFIWIKKRKAKIPLIVFLLGGWVIFLGIISIVSSFINIFQLDNQGLINTAGIIFLFFGAFFFGIGVAIVHLQSWVRRFFLIFIIITGILATAIAVLAKVDPKLILIVNSISLFHFMVYYFGLAKKYFEFGSKARLN